MDRVNEALVYCTATPPGFLIKWVVAMEENGLYEYAA